MSLAERTQLKRAFAQSLRKHRRAKGFSQAQVAELAGISYPYYNRLERASERSTISLFYLLRLSSVLGIEVLTDFTHYAASYAAQYASTSSRPRETSSNRTGGSSPSSNI